MKVYRLHRCSSRHRKHTAFARCVWPSAAWVHGEGPYACVAQCRALTVQLHETAEDATASEDWIDQMACGGFCTGDHELVELRLSEQP